MAELPALATSLSPCALSFCSGSSLAALRCCASCLAEAIPVSSPLWAELLQLQPARLQQPKSPMHQAQRLGRAVERCTCTREDRPSPTPVNKSHRYRIIVTGARGSGISTLVRIMTQRELENRGKDMSLMNFSAQLEDLKLTISAVDKRSTAIVTPLSAALYNGHSAALFVFDAGNMEESLSKTAWCIAELKQTVGPQKFRLMPKVLVCHKSDLLQEYRVPPMCEALMSTYGMDLVFTTHLDPHSVHVAVALVAEHWPETDPDDASRKFPMISRQQLRPTRTCVRGYNLVARRPQNLLEELHARVPRVE